MKKTEIEAAVRRMADEAAEKAGLSIWDVRFEKEGRDHFLRVYVDRPGGRMSIDDCVNVSEALDGPLDEADLIDVPYSLQVSSPGLERRLTRPEHYEWAIGRKVMLKVRGTADRQGGICYGVLKEYTKDSLTVSFDTGDEVFLPNETVWVKADDFDDFDVKETEE